LAKIKKRSIALSIVQTPPDKNVSNIMEALFSRTKKGGIVIWIASDTTKNFNESGVVAKQLKWIRKTGFNVVDTMIYSNVGSIDPYFTSSQDRLKRYADCFKYMFVLSIGKPKTFNPIATKNIGNVWTFNDIDQHLSISDQCAEDLILTYSNEKDIVFIPFGDNGTIAKIAQEYGRLFIMTDVSKKDKRAVKDFINQDVISFSIIKPDKKKKKKVRGKTQAGVILDDKSFEIERDNSIFVSGEEIKKMTKKEYKKFVKRLWKHYRKVGFPYPTFTDAELNASFQKLVEIDVTTLCIKENILKRDATGLKIANAYMPHMWGIKSHNFKTPLESFNDPKQFIRAIQKSVKFSGNVTDGTLRSAFRWVTGTQMVSNFRPTIAKYFYDLYSAPNGRVVDFSCGYGGRLIAACASTGLKEYWGADPCKETFKNLKRLKRDYGKNKKIVLKNTGFENTVFKRGYFDLCFSSPPYFNQEEYGDENDQSFINFNTKEKWRKNFLYGAIIKKCWKYLRPGGYFIINIANVQMYKDL